MLLFSLVDINSNLANPNTKNLQLYVGKHLLRYQSANQLGWTLDVGRPITELWSCVLSLEYNGNTSEPYVSRLEYNPAHMNGGLLYLYAKDNNNRFVPGDEVLVSYVVYYK